MNIPFHWPFFNTQKQQANDPTQIQVGRDKSEGLDLWCLQQAIAEGEKRLVVQTQIHDGMMTRCTMLIGFVITIILGIITASIALKMILLAILCALMGTLSLICFLIALYPKYWQTIGNSPNWFASTPYPTEFQILEAVSKGTEEAISSNDQILKITAKYIKTGLGWLCAFPLVIILGYVIRILTS